MRVNTPGTLELALLALAAFRVWRLLAKDTILDRPRRWVVRLGDWQAGEDTPAGYREGFAIWLECPWCAGFWVTGIALGAYCALFGWVGVFSFLVVWFALSAVVALIAKTLDSDE